MITPVQVWVDPSCPWAWQTVQWLLDLRNRGLIRPSWSLFSLEVNSSPPGTPFPEAAARYGPALATLALARERSGAPGFEALYTALGERLHERKLEPSDVLLQDAAEAAGLSTLPAEAAARVDLGDALIDEHRAARQLDVFGVPSLGIADHKVVYGPIIALAPRGDDALSLWDDVRALAARDDFFELKRWPRDERPGRSAGAEAHTDADASQATTT
jgi:predicted DsbA family dithiol-disulfide isomerase